MQIYTLLSQKIDCSLRINIPSSLNNHHQIDINQLCIKISNSQGFFCQNLSLYYFENEPKSFGLTTAQVLSQLLCTSVPLNFVFRSDSSTLYTKIIKQKNRNKKKHKIRFSYLGIRSIKLRSFFSDKRYDIFSYPANCRKF